MIGPVSVFNMRANPIQAYNRYGAWYDYLNPFKAAKAAADYFQDDGPPAYDEVTAPDPDKIVASEQIKDGAYSWIVYSNGDLKIFDVPEGKEELINTRYRIGDSNYAKTLATLRTRSPKVDKVLAKGGLDGAKLAAGATRNESVIQTSKSSKGGAITNGNGGGGIDVMTVVGISAGVIGLIILSSVLFRRRRKK